MLHLAIAAALLYLFWILLSGFFTPFLLAAGAASSIAVLWFSHRMDVVDREGHPYHLSWSAATYWPWLVKEILKSAIDVSKRILSPSLPISPTVVHFPPHQKTVVGLVTHANSITLTPGTLAVEVSPGNFTVHGLSREGAEGCIDSDMDLRVVRFEGGADGRAAGAD